MSQQKIFVNHVYLFFTLIGEVLLVNEYDHSNAPGVIINYLPAISGSYLGSPSVLILPNSEYLVSHDYFGPGTNYDTMEMSYFDPATGVSFDGSNPFIPVPPGLAQPSSPAVGL